MIHRTCNEEKTILLHTTFNPRMIVRYDTLLMRAQHWLIL